MDFLNRLGARTLFALIAAAGFGLVGVGVLIGELMRINPCPLCIFQRVLYLAVAAVALAGAVLPGCRRIWGGLIGAVSTGGLATALYQSWMQLNPESVTQCGFGEPSLIERFVDWLGMLWPYLFMATGFCTSREDILGLSMANWSLFCFAGFLLVGVWAGWRRQG